MTSLGSTTALVLFAAALAGCALPDANQVDESPQAPPHANAASSPAYGQASVQTGAGTESSLETAVASAQPLPFKGRLVSGEADELPPAVAASLNPSAPITFTYREDLTHDEYHIPLWFSAIDPVTYVGAPLGDFGATASAALTIQRGDDILGQYTAKAHVSKHYTLYSQPTHREVDAAARAAVRAKIDQQLAGDDARLRQAAHEGSTAPAQ